MAETAKKPLHRPIRKVTPKKTTLNSKDAHATCSGRFDVIVIAYLECTSVQGTSPQGTSPNKGLSETVSV